MAKPSLSTARKRAISHGNQDTTNDIPLKDEGEQDAEIRELEAAIRRLSQRTSRVATLLAGTLTAVELYLALVQYRHPFSLRHHAAFAEAGLASLYVGEIASALAVATSGLCIFRFVHPNPAGLSWKYAINCALLMTALQMIYWAAAIASLYVSVSAYRGRTVAWGLVWWKPLPAILMFAFAVMSIDSISKMQIDLGLMQKAKYRFKTI